MKLHYHIHILQASIRAAYKVTSPIKLKIFVVYSSRSYYIYYLNIWMGISRKAPSIHKSKSSLANDNYFFYAKLTWTTQFTQ